MAAHDAAETVGAVPILERWPKLFHGPIELSGCVAQGEPDKDTVTLAATLTAGKRSLGVEVVAVNARLS